jgi:hypothetical protein
MLDTSRRDGNHTPLARATALAGAGGKVCPVHTENLVRIDHVVASPKLAK